MTDYLIMLLSTDWFLPYWIEIGIEISEGKRIGIQQGCHEIISEMLGELDNFYLIDFSGDRRRNTELKFLALLSKWNAKLEVSATLKEWANLSHKELSAVWLCATSNSEVASTDALGVEPDLEFSIRAEVLKIWEVHALKADVFRDVCLSSNTDWDVRIRKQLSSPNRLVNKLWSVLLDHRLRFWRDLRERLTAQQLQQLASWYRAMIKGRSKDDRGVLLPSYME